METVNRTRRYRRIRGTYNQNDAEKTRYRLVKPATEALARHIAAESLLNHFLLVGGTALSIYLNHRLSEDLDFATTDKSLPTKAISALLERLGSKGCVIEDATPVAARQDAINDGYDIEEYYQDWLVDGVKLTFFILEEKNGRKKLANDQGNPWNQNLRLCLTRYIICHQVTGTG